MIGKVEAKKLLGAFLADAVKAVKLGAEEHHALALQAETFVSQTDLVQRGTENREQKGRRYLTEGRITVTRMTDAGLIVAEARGSGDTYHLGYDPRRGQWRCTCEAKGQCSHLVALQLIVHKPTRTRGATP